MSLELIDSLSYLVLKGESITELSLLLILSLKGVLGGNSDCTISPFFKCQIVMTLVALSPIISD
jgi:hypothetical protein